MARAFTDNQNQAIHLNGTDICVAAGAGSGKTGVLVERFIRIVLQSRLQQLPPNQRARVDEILVITFTEKATKEMKTRIVEQLTRLGLTDERRQVETAYISTIHGFCSRLLQENPFEVGIDPHFTVMEEPRARRLLRQSVETAIARAYETNDEETTELVASVQALRRYGEEQADPITSLAEAVENVLGKLRSAGRTREELDRHWQNGPQAVAAGSESVVFMVVAPLLDEVRACAEDLRTLYAGLLGTARASCDLIVGCSDRIAQATTLIETLSVLRELHGLVGKARTRIIGATNAELQLAQHIGRIKALCDARAPLLGVDLPDSEETARACYRMWKLTSAVWCDYDQAKRMRGLMDNDDLQAECVRLLQEYPDVRDRYRQKIRYLMVDEFQDTNPLQMRLIDLLHASQGSESPATDGEEYEFERSHTDTQRDQNYLFVVGDVQQSIYGFRGADPSVFRAIERRYREGDAGAHVPLSVNFRSRPEILRLIAHLFRNIWRDSRTPFVPLEAGANFDSASTPSVEILLSQDLVRQDYIGLEPAALARRIRQVVESGEVRLTSHLDPRRGEPVRYRDVAVLLRQLTDIQKYEEAFAQAGVPCFVVGGGRGYYARQEIRDLLNILTVLDTPLNDLALMAALRSPMVGADIDTLYRIVEASYGRFSSRDGSGSYSESGGAGPQSVTVSGTVKAGIGDRSAQPRQAGGSTLPLYIALKRLLETGTLPSVESDKLTLFLTVMDSLREQEDRMPVGHLLERLISRTSYDARLLCRPNGRRRLANVRKLLQMANSESVLGVREFIRRLRDLEKLSDREGDAPTEEEAADVVRFHTIHGAKGLEFPVVVLADTSRTLEHPEHGLFLCDPGQLALGTRVCGSADSVYRAIDHRRRESDREESERLLYVAMTRARERLILCGNIGRSRGLNWGESLFSALGIVEAPPQPEVRTLIGGVEALLAPLSHYVHTSIAGGARPAGQNQDDELMQFVERLADALLNDEAIDPILT